MVKTKYLRLINFYLLTGQFWCKAKKSIINILLACLSITAQISNANPEGGVVTAGNAAISNNNQGMVEINQHSDRAVIDWQTFNIGIKEQTKFVQPSIDAITLNRIHSHSPSEINGQLIANGKLILINQNGILFGQKAKVDVNGLIAATANIGNEQFMQSKIDSNLLIFDQPGEQDASIINEGQIVAKQGLIGMVAPNVFNSGLIVAKAAKIQLSSGETFTLDLYGDNLINIAVSEGLKNQLVLNSGKIIADGHQIALTAAAGKELINSLIANSGALQAKTVAQNNGEIIIMAEGSNAVINNKPELKGIKSGESKVIVSGVIDVSGLREGESGGKLQILADDINLIDNAVINTSGYSGKYRTTFGMEKSTKRIGSAGGEILVGGDYLGKGKVPCAIKLTVGPDVTIYNDSYGMGDAGRSIFWSDKLNSFAGQVYSRSLSSDDDYNPGDGGFVEISGKQLILNQGYYTELSAVNGTLGTLFLDPTNIKINEAFLTANNTANIEVLADQVEFDLYNNVFNIGNDFNFTVVANESINVITGGTINTNKTSTGGNITLDSSVAVNIPINLANLTLNAQNGGAVTINTAGAVTLGNVSGGSLLVHTIGSASDIVIPAESRLTLTNASNPLILAAGGNLKNQHSAGDAFNLTAAGARWLIYSSNVQNDQGVGSDLIGPYGVLYGKYNINSLPNNLIDNLLTYTGAKLFGDFSNKDTAVDDAQTNKKMVTINNLRLTGPAANNYTLESDTTASGYIGTIIPRQITPSLVNEEVVKTYDGNTTANNLTTSNYNISNVIAGDVNKIELTNYSVGNYTRRQADPQGTNQIISVTGLGLDGVESANYALTTDSVSANVGHINPKTIAPAFDPLKVIQKTYDGNNIADLTHDKYVVLTDVVIVDGVKDDVALMPVTQGAYDHVTADSFWAYQPVTVVDLSINPEGADAANYILSPTSITTNNEVGRINRRALTATLLGPINKVYDGYNNITQPLVYNHNPDDQNPTNFVLNNIVAEDLNTVQLNYNDAVYNDRLAKNNKNVIVTGISLTGGNASSYTISSNVFAPVGNITPKPVTASLLPGVTKVYDGTTVATVPYVNQSISGLVIDGVVNDSVALTQPN